jgi:hypothetical protein
MRALEVPARTAASPRTARGMVALVSLTVASMIAGCGLLPGSAPATKLRFTDVALQAGLQDRENKGRAAAAADLNGDGWLDFYLGNPGSTSRIFLSNGPDATGNFTWRPGQILLDGPEVFAFGAAFGDYDNDGRPDLFVASGGADGAMLRIQSWDHLFHNTGDGTFVEVSDQAGVKGHLAQDGALDMPISSQGVWGDYDRDGYLDLFVSNQYDTGNSLFHNNGDGTFTNVTAQSGLGLDTKSMAASWGDFDDDGWLDLFVPHSKGGHHSLYHNNKDGTFTRIGSPAFTYPWADWAGASGDLNQDGLLDAVGFAAKPVRRKDFRGRTIDSVRTTAYDLLNTLGIGSKRDVDLDYEGLYVNVGENKFEDQAAASGWSPKGAATSSSMGNQVGDLNNDGMPELYIANGAPNSGEEDVLLENVGEFGGPVKFRDVSEVVRGKAPDDPNFRLTRPLRTAVFGLRASCEASERAAVRQNAAETGASVVFGCVEIPVKPGDPEFVAGSEPGNNWDEPYPYRGHGVIFVDYNHDNKIDIFASKGGPVTIPSTIEPNRFWRNDTPDVGALLTLKLVGKVSNLDGAGARIVARPTLNGVARKPRYVDARDQNGFGASVWGETYIGLGQADHATLEIHWPSGAVQVLPDLAVNQRLTVNEADALTFADSFDKAIDPNIWNRQRGDWTWKQRQAESCGGLISSRDFSGVDGEVVTKLTVGETGSAGLVVRSGGSGGGIAALVTASGLQAGPLADVHNTAPQDIGPVGPGRMVLLRVRFHGQSVDVQADEGPAITVQDASPAAGPIGLLVEDGCASFDHVAVTR